MSYWYLFLSFSFFLTQVITYKAGVEKGKLKMYRHMMDGFIRADEKGYFKVDWEKVRSPQALYEEMGITPNQLEEV